MINLNKKSSKLLLNRHFSKNCTEIKLLNISSREEYVFSNLTDESESEFFYILSPVDMSNLEDGTYNIELIDGNGETFETQLGVSGDYKRSTKTYEKEIKRTVYER